MQETDRRNIVSNKNHNLSKQALLQKGLRTQINSVYKANLLLTIGVLYDKFNFSADDVNDFVSLYNEVLISYNAGNENLQEWAKNIEELTGVIIKI